MVRVFLYLATCMQWIFWISAVVISLIAGYSIYLTERKRGSSVPWLAGILRSSVIFLCFLLLLAPQISTERTREEKPVIVFLQDNSASFPLALEKDSTSYIPQTEAFLDQLSKNYRVVRWGFGREVQPDSLFIFEQQATDISHALHQAVTRYGKQNLGAILLSSDGRYNQGINPLYMDLAYQGVLYTLIPGDTTEKKDLRIVKTYANKSVSLHSQFEIRVDIAAEQCEGYKGQIRLAEANGTILTSLPVQVNTNRWGHSVSFTLKAEKTGLHHYIVSLPAAPGEKNIHNNQQDIFITVVEDKKNILLAAAAPHPDIQSIREGLAGLDGYHITTAWGDHLPADLSGFDVMIFHSLPSNQVPVRQLAASEKPFWIISGYGASVTAYNQIQQMARLNVNSGNLRPVQGSLSGNFSLFAPPDALRGIQNKLPPLNVPAGTITADVRSEVLFHARENPQMPLWLFGTGRIPSVLLAGEGLWRWRMYAYRFLGTTQPVDELIRQTVAYLAHHSTTQPFRVSMPKQVWSEEEWITFSAELRNAANEQINTPEVTLSLSDEAGKKMTYTFEKTGNHYRLQVGRLAPGKYTYSATAEFAGRSFTENGRFAVQQVPLEKMITGTDHALLYALSRKYGGNAFPVSETNRLYDAIEANSQIRPILKTTTTQTPLIDRKWYFFLILLAATAEWLVRKYKGMEA